MEDRLVESIKEIKDIIYQINDLGEELQTEYLDDIAKCFNIKLKRIKHKVKQ